MRNFAPTSKLLLVFISIFISVFCSDLSAQSDQFITPVTPLSLTAKQNEMKEKVIKNSFFKEIQFVQMGSLPVLQNGGILKFSIPGRSGQIEAHATRVEAFSYTDYEWYGKIDGGLGNIIILSKKGKITASIHLPDQTYEIISTDGDAHILVTYDREKSETLKNCATKEKDKKQKKEVNTNINPLRVEPCQDRTRVLVLFTPAAQQAVPDINQTINLCISQFNQAIYNSSIPTNAYVELAGSQLLNFVESPDIQEDLNALVDNVNAQAARNNTNADYVILLTGASYSGFHGSAATVEPDNIRSYAIAEINSATNEQKIFVHEAGHLYGCRHHDSTDPTAQPYAHGYIFRPNFLAPQCYTIMVSGSEIHGSRSRLLNFSNPNVSIQGEPTGTSSANDNARRVTETFSILRDFRAASFRPLTASIFGTQTGDECTQGDWEAVVSCGAAPYTFEWSKSYDGFNYYVQSSGEFFSDILNCPADLYRYYYLRLIVNSSDGQTATAFLTVYVNHSDDPPYKAFKEINVDEKLNSNYLIAYPNPTGNTTKIKIQLTEAQPVKLEILNSFGQAVRVLINGNLQKGKHYKDLNTDGLSKGLYLYKLTGPGFSITKKLVIK